MLFVPESDLSDSNKSDQASPPEQQSSGSEISTDRQFQPSESVRNYSSDSNKADQASPHEQQSSGSEVSTDRQFQPSESVRNKDQSSKASDYLSSLDDAPQDHERHGRTKKDKKAEDQWVIFRNSQVGAS